MALETINLLVEEAGARLDVYLAGQALSLTRSRIQKLVEEGQVLVNGAVKKANYRVNQGDRIALSLPEPRQRGECGLGAYGHLCGDAAAGKSGAGHPSTASGHLCLGGREIDRYLYRHPFLPYALPILFLYQRRYVPYAL